MKLGLKLKTKRVEIKILSLAETLDGEVNVAMLVYQSGEAAIQLFSGDSPEARKILGAALPALATQGDYKVRSLTAPF